MTEIEMARAADGSEKHLPTKPIKGADLNVDSDEEIMSLTDKSEGKWRFYSSEGKLVAEAASPGQISAGVVQQWCNAVRARCKRELTQEDVDRKLAAEENKTNGGIIVPDGVTDNVRSDSAVHVPESEGVAVDDDPDAFVAGKIAAATKRAKAATIKRAELVEQVSEVEAEIAAAEKDVSKWRRMQESINAED